MKLTERDKKFWREFDNTTDKERADYFYSVFDRRYSEIFVTMKMEGLISKEIELDFMTFNEKAKELWEQLGLEFSVLYVFAALPENKWCEICINRVEQQQ